MSNEPRVQAAEVYSSPDHWPFHLPVRWLPAHRHEVCHEPTRPSSAARAPGAARDRENTLSALVEKQDIDIPLLESLELIAEPDGSTEDFIIPDWLEERQRLKRAPLPAN